MTVHLKHLIEERNAHALAIIPTEIGLSETCARTFVLLPNEMEMPGRVGPPVPNVDVCLESVPETGYDALASTPRREICVKGVKPFFQGTTNVKISPKRTDTIDRGDIGE